MVAMRRSSNLDVGAANRGHKKEVYRFTARASGLR